MKVTDGALHVVNPVDLRFQWKDVNSNLFEMPVPAGILDFGLKNSISVRENGMVMAPSAPRLCFEVARDAKEDGTGYRM